MSTTYALPILDPYSVPVLPTAPSISQPSLPQKIVQALHNYTVIKRAQKLNIALDSFEQHAATCDKTQAQALLTKCQNCMLKITETKQITPELKTAYDNLRGRFCSLKYRTLSDQERLVLPANIPSVEDLSQKIAALKATHPVMKQLPQEDQAVTKHEFEILQNLVQRYPEMAIMINEDPITLNAFFTYVCHRNVPLDAFVQFPNTITKLSSLVSTRFGHFSNFLHVEDLQNGKKQLTIPYIHTFGQRRVNILDESALLHLENNVTITVKELYSHIMQKPTVMGPVEIFPEGIRLFDSGQYVGANGPIDFTQPEWYKKLPAWETLTAEQANTKYGKFLHGAPLDGKTNWMVALCASAKNKGQPDAAGVRQPDLTDVHGYKVILIPSGDGNYSVIPFGKIPRKAPDMRSITEMYNFVADTSLAEIQYDMNYFTESRLHGMVCHSLPKEQGEWYMNNILGRDMQAGRDGNLIFQFADHNCTEWVISCWEELRRKFPEYHAKYPLPDHLVSILQTAPSHPALKHFVSKLKMLPPKIQKIFMSVTLLFLRATRGQTIHGNHYSLWTSQNFTDPLFNIYNPVPLFSYQCSESNVNGHKCVRESTHLKI
jgi:hypothetical protein